MMEWDTPAQPPRLPVGSITFGAPVIEITPTATEVLPALPNPQPSRIARVVAKIVGIAQEAAWEAKWQTEKRKHRRWMRALRKSQEPPRYI